ncbi:unnamed protein product, partial [Polarella glacialis]
DDSGCLSLAELLEGFDTVKDMSDKFRSLDIERDDLQGVYHFIDTVNGKTDSLSLDQLISVIQKAERQDVRVQLMLMQLQMNEINWRLTTQLEGISDNVKLLVQDSARDRAARSSGN